jgi:hypothetical protein
MHVDWIAGLVVCTWPFAGLLIGALVGGGLGAPKKGAWIGFAIHTALAVAGLLVFFSMLGGVI